MDWIAMLCTLGAIWLLGSQRLLGWGLGIVGNVLWIWYAARTSQPPILLLNAAFIGLNVRGWLKWNT